MLNTILTRKTFIFFISILSIISCSDFPRNLQKIDDIFNPTLALYIGQNGIQTLQKFLIPQIFNDEQINLPLPDQFETHIDFIGNLKLNITKWSIKFDKVKDNQLNLTFTDKNMFNLTVNNISATLNFTYDFISGFYENHNASGNITLTNLGIDLSTTVGSVKNINQTNKLGPNFIINNITIPISPELKVNFNTQAIIEGIIKFFFELISKSVIDNAVTRVANLKISELNSKITSFFANLDLTASLGVGKVDYQLSTPPTINNGTLEIALDANLTATNYTYTGKKYEIPHLFYNDTAFTLVLNEYFIDGYFDILQKYNQLSGYVEGKNLQNPAFPFNVKRFNDIFNGLEKKYNQEYIVDLNITSLEKPLVSFKDNSLKTKFNVTVDFIVCLPENKSETAVSLNLVLLADLNLSLKDGKINFDLQNISIDTIKVLSSTIGEINADNLKFSLNIFLGFVVKPLIPKDFDLGNFVKGIPGVLLKQTKVEPHDGYIQIDLKPTLNVTNILTDKSFLSGMFEGMEKIKKVMDSNNMKFLN